MSAISDRILHAIQSAGLSYGEVSKKTKIPKSALQRYSTGDTPKGPIDRIEAIARCTGVSAQYLMGWDNEAPITHSDNNRLSEFVKLFQQLTDEQQTLIISQIKGILSNQ